MRAALTLSLTACGAQTAGTSESQGTLTGQVTEVDGSQVTLLLGTLNENENGSGTAPDGTPDRDPGQGGQAGTPPEKPAGSTDSGSTNSQPPAKPDGGSTGSGGTPPEMPSGGQPGGAAPSGNAPQGEPPARPGSSFSIQDSSGSTVYSGTALCSANYVFFSSSKLSADASYTLCSGSTSAATATAQTGTASADLTGFSDQAAISSFARPAMSWAKASGLMDGNDTGALAPKGAATRAQMAMILTRLCEKAV